MKQRYVSCMKLHALGDTVGFKNTKWEFSEGGYERTLTKVYEFIELGGITKISLKGWNVSDDTIMHIHTARALLEYEKGSSIDSLGKLFKKEFIVALNQFENEMDKRAPGISTMGALTRLKNGGNWDDTPYNIYSGGSGASMRSLCIGMAFYGEENRHKLIQISIESGRMTNNSAVGYLGGMTSALFAAFAIEGVQLTEWVYKLLDMFNDGTIQKYMKTSERGYDNFMRDYHVFVEKWHRYVDDKFDDKKNVVKRKSSRNLIYRSKYYNETFGFRGEVKTGGKVGPVREFGSSHEKNEEKNVEGKYGEVLGTGFIGSGGDDSMIIAYDCLIDSENNWEKLTYYAMLHMGDTDTTGSIAGGLFGLMYGFDDIGKHLLEHLEYSDELQEIGELMYDKYYNK